jgi:hypothetical protein
LLCFSSQNNNNITVVVEAQHGSRKETNTTSHTSNHCELPAQHMPRSFARRATPFESKATIVTITALNKHSGGGAGGGWGGNPGTRGGNGGVGVGFYTVVPGTSYAVTIGAGASGANPSGTGGTGGSSSFGSLLTATGGVGGVREFGQRSNGTGALGTIINNSTEFFSPLELSRAYIANSGGNYYLNFYPNPNNGGSQSAQTYTISFNYSAGAGGAGGPDGDTNNSGGASVSGAVYLEYVGS